MSLYIDMHMHSTASDGTKTPRELVQLAVEAVKTVILTDCEKETNVQPIIDSREETEHTKAKIYVALTDHDTVSGLSEFLEEASRFPEIHAKAGVEISSDYLGTEIHILGYDIDPANESLQSALAVYRDSRDSRNSRMLEKFQEIGIPITEEDIAPEKEGDSVGRPAFARYLVEHGYVKNTKEAFDLYLADGKCCYVDRIKPSPEEAITLIKNSGGFAVLAHPVLYRKLTSEQIDKLIAMMKEHGLKGMEVYYSESSEVETLYYEGLAKKHGLILTGGSDYHGDNKPEIALFKGHGGLKVPNEVALLFQHQSESPSSTSLK